ncbi:Transposon Tf2-9 polyprotein [Araneus ventricosus]|uniref:RNA-directed DNA polymerase n=1 Tax=Araneus ventricosus TaxID=182803 RepID=A0A4Y2DJ85_ARAVE|nr:Transposon Tf2-9 polyprotein [Araneus ventricosus]GBM16882.1 Transposon Tf2-9 polyprotein [Araneus ventricosus]
MLDIEPGQSKIVILSIPSSLRDSGSFIFIPNANKLNYNIQNSLHEYNENNKFTTIIENNSNQKIRIRKKTKIGVIQKFHEEDIVEPTDQIGQVNTISLEKVKRMRKEELNPNQFNLNHLNGKVKEEILQLLINNYSVFSSTYSTLGSTDKVVPEFKLYHDYALQTKPYPIPKIAKEYAQEETKKLLDAGIIEASSSSYCFPVIFVKKKPLPGKGNKQKFRMAIDYRLLNCITESHKICLPKIMDIIQNIAGKIALAQPIVNLVKKNSEFIWDKKCKDSFNKFQDMMLTKPSLKNIKHNEKLYLITDASKVAVCGILMQKSNGKFVPIKFYSKQLNPAEIRYPSIRRELYAIVLSVKHFSEHLYGREFSILTDAKPLSHHIHLDKQPDIVARWLLYLQSFSYSIEHVPGFSNPADFLTRVQEETHINNLKIFSILNGMNYDNIKSHQQNDKETKEIIDKINDNKNVTCKDYYMDNNSGLLMIKIKHLRNKQIENKIVIPKSLVKTCLESAHGPHFGTTKTFNVVKKNYYWKNYFLDTKKFCENCHECIKNKSKATNTQFEMISKSHLAPGQFIAIDIVGKPRSYDGKCFILTIIDHYSPFLEAIPLPNITSSTIIKALNQYFARFGIPKLILTDNGTNLRSNEIDSFFSELQIEHRKTSIYFPQSNGT